MGPSFAQSWLLLNLQANKQDHLWSIFKQFILNKLEMLYDKAYLSDYKYLFKMKTFTL